MKGPKHLILGLTLLLLAELPVGFAIYFLVEGACIRHEMKEQLERSHLQTIQLHPRDILWLEEHKELKIGDRFFDVYSSTLLANGQLQLCGLFDEEETELNKLIDKKLFGGEQQEHNIQFAALFFQCTFEKLLNDDARFHQFSIDSVRNDFYVSSLPTFHLPKDFPPPKV